MLPSQANFVLVELGVDDVAVCDELMRRGILIRAGSEFGLPGFARVTVAPERRDADGRPPRSPTTVGDAAVTRRRGNGLAMTAEEIPAAVRARDLVGYGRNPPGISWPGGAKVVINLVLVYEAGSEYSVAWGDDRNDGWGEYADPGRAAAAARSRHRGALRVRQPRGRLAPRAHLRRAAVPVTVSAAAVALELNPAVAEWMRERDHDLLGHGWRWTEAWTYTPRGGARR